MEVAIANEIRDRYLFDGNLKIASKEKADLILKGELIHYDRDALRFTESDTVQEFRIYVSVNMIMKDTVKEEIKWIENGFSGETTYFIEGPQSISESEAVQAAIEDLARRVVERTIEDW
jgi:hypothetical protein